VHDYILLEMTPTTIILEQVSFFYLPTTT